MTAIDPDYASQITVPYLAGDEASIMVTRFNPLEGAHDVYLEVGVWYHTYFIVRRLGYWARDYKYRTIRIDMRKNTMKDVQDAIDTLAAEWQAHQDAVAVTAAFASSGARIES